MLNQLNYSLSISMHVSRLGLHSRQLLSDRSLELVHSFFARILFFLYCKISHLVSKLSDFQQKLSLKSLMARCTLAVRNHLAPGGHLS